MFLYVVTLVFFVWYSQILLPWNEQRPYLVAIEDMAYDWLPRFDVSVPVCIIQLYALLLFVWEWQQWDQELFAGSMLCLMCSRTLVLLFLPLRAHPTHIPLRDPFIELITGAGKPLQHDLAFSGHTSTLALLALVHTERSFCYWHLTWFTALLLLCGRVHYTIDTVLAPVFSWWAVQCVPYLLPLSIMPWFLLIFLQCWTLYCSYASGLSTCTPLFCVPHLCSAEWLQVLFPDAVATSTDYEAHLEEE